MTPEETKAYRSAQYQKNRDKVLKTANEYYAANRETILAYKKAYAAENREEIAIKKAARYQKNKDVVLAKSKTRYSDKSPEILEQQAEWRLQAKKEGLAHYGKNGQLQCCWPECDITDLDMLTLDHIVNDGAEHRRKKFPGGASACTRLKNAGYPEGFQTLCANHQLKKETERKRLERKQRHAKDAILIRAQRRPSLNSKHVHETKYHTYQVRIQGDYYGTFKTLEKAMAVRNAVLTQKGMIQ